MVPSQNSTSPAVAAVTVAVSVTEVPASAVVAVLASVTVLAVVTVVAGVTVKSDSLLTVPVRKFVLVELNVPVMPCEPIARAVRLLVVVV